jgi:hypothetical protein
VCEIAIAGGGIGMVPNFIAAPALKQGLLQEVLPGYKTMEFGLFALYPHRHYLPIKVRCFIDFLVATFSRCTRHGQRLTATGLSLPWGRWQHSLLQHKGGDIQVFHL